MTNEEFIKAVEQLSKKEEWDLLHPPSGWYYTSIKFDFGENNMDPNDNTIIGSSKVWEKNEDTSRL